MLTQKPISACDGSLISHARGDDKTSMQPHIHPLPFHMFRQMQTSAYSQQVPCSPQRSLVFVKTRASNHLVRAVRSTRRTESRATRLGFVEGRSCVFLLAPIPCSCWYAVERRSSGCLVTVTPSTSLSCDRPCRFHRRRDNAVPNLRQLHGAEPLPRNSTEVHVAHNSGHVSLICEDLSLH